MTFNPDGETWVIKPEFREQVEFRLQDIRHAVPEEDFDLILCRHMVFTYFDEQLQQEILQKLLGKLRSGGVLVTGKQEALPKVPATLVARTNSVPPSERARPKSQTWALSPTIKMFWGLMSQCWMACWPLPKSWIGLLRKSIA